MKQYANFLTKARKFTGVALGSTLLLFSCQQEQGNGLQNIAHQIKENNCMIEKYNKEVDQSWTVVLEKLDQMIPQTLPDQERDRMLILKNASLIRMFKSYDDFGDKIHMLVDSMEQVDAKVAETVRNLSLENQKMEMKIDSIFSTMGNSETEQMLYQELQDIKSGACDDMSMTH